MLDGNWSGPLDQPLKKLILKQWRTGKGSVAIALKDARSSERDEVAAADAEQSAKYGKIFSLEAINADEHNGQTTAQCLSTGCELSRKGVLSSHDRRLLYRRQSARPRSYQYRVSLRVEDSTTTRLWPTAKARPRPKNNISIDIRCERMAAHLFVLIAQWSAVAPNVRGPISPWLHVPEPSHQLRAVPAACERQSVTQSGALSHLSTAKSHA